MSTMSSHRPLPVSSTVTDRVIPAETDPVTLEYGANTGNGNLLGIQAYMTPKDYRSEDMFLAKLDFYLALAQKNGWIDPKTIVVFPELIGFYLFTLHETDDVYAAPSLVGAAARILRNHQAELSNRSIRIASGDPIQQARRLLLEFKAPVMAQAYQRVFSTLASRYHVTIIAGSILLSGPSVRDGNLVTDISGPLHNVSAVFETDGELVPDLVLKVFPTYEEVQELGVKPGEVSSLPVLATASGTLGVVICADSWYPQAFQTLRQKGAKIVVTPSHYADPARMGALWNGYSLSPGLDAPGDVKPDDIGQLTEAGAWLKYAMPGRIGNTPLQAARFRYGMTVFTRGEFWDETSAGGFPFLLDHGKLVRLADRSGAPAVVSFWLA